MSNALLGPEEQKRLVDGILSEVSTFRSDVTDHVVTALGTKYGGSAIKDALSSATYAFKVFLGVNASDHGSHLAYIGDKIANAVASAVKK